MKKRKKGGEEEEEDKIDLKGRIEMLGACIQQCAAAMSTMITVTISFFLLRLSFHSIF